MYLRCDKIVQIEYNEARFKFLRCSQSDAKLRFSFETTKERNRKMNAKTEFNIQHFTFNILHPLYP